MLKGFPEASHAAQPSSYHRQFVRASGRATPARKRSHIEGVSLRVWPLSYLPRVTHSNRPSTTAGPLPQRSTRPASSQAPLLRAPHHDYCLYPVPRWVACAFMSGELPKNTLTTICISQLEGILYTYGTYANRSNEITLLATCASACAARRRISCAESPRRVTGHVCYAHLPHRGYLAVGRLRRHLDVCLDPTPAATFCGD